MTHKHKKEEFHHDEDHEHTETKIWKLIVGFFLFVPALSLAFVNTDNNWQVWVEFFLATSTILLLGWDYLHPVIHELKEKKLSVNLLVLIASGSAYVYSVVEMILILTGVGGMTANMLLFEAVVEIMVLIYLGRVLEDKLTEKSGREVEYLLKLYSDEAILFDNGKETLIKAELLKPNDIVIVKKGQKVPSDGIIIEGSSDFDESAFTGESVPVSKTINDVVYCGTVATATIIVKISVAPSDSEVGKIITAIKSTQMSKPKPQKIADKITQWFIPTIVFLALSTFVMWGAIAGALGAANAWYNAYVIMITVMVIACPCSFGIITPMSVLVSSGVSLKRGILFTNKRVIEQDNNMDIVMVDKTGTLTEGKMEVRENTIPQQYWKAIYAVEKKSTHSIAQSIAIYFDKMNISFENGFEFNEQAGKGIDFIYNGEKHFFGSFKWAKEMIPTIDPSIVDANFTSVILFNHHEVIGKITLEDKIKETAFEFVQVLQSRGVRVAMVTGDHRNNALYVAKQLGILESEVYAEVSPQEKAAIISDLQKQGKKVTFIGDGINDSIALKQSDLAIAVGTGTAVALEAASITLQKNDLTLAIDSIILANKTRQTIYIGFTIAVIYNATMIPLAMAGLLSPLIAGLSMMISDTLAIFVALTLRRFAHRKHFYKKHEIKK